MKCAVSNPLMIWGLSLALALGYFARNADGYVHQHTEIVPVANGELLAAGDSSALGGAAHDQDTYAIEDQAGSAFSFSTQQGVQATYGATGFALEVNGPHGPVQSRFTLLGIDKGGQALLPTEGAALETEGNRLQVDHGSFVMAYENLPEGMRHDVIVREEPEGDGVLRARFRLEGDLLAVPVSEKELALHWYDLERQAISPVIRYNGLKAWDAKGTPLVSRMELEGDAVVLAVEAEGAVYPVTIDPLSSTADRTLAGVANERKGESVRTAGDVNGDGYSDLLVGSPAWGGGKGRVELYLGSAAGIGSSPDWSLEGTTAGDSLGRSVSTAGDMNGDGFGDIVIGAPGKNNAKGQALVFFGVEAAVPSNTPAHTLNGENVGDRFGFSVALAGDVNNDNLSDILVGAPGFSSDLGKAYCFHGKASGTYSGANAGANWNRIGETMNGVATGQFGYCVTGAGDLNGDGYSDIAVGAPFMRTKRINYEHGSFYLFRGSASGLSATPLRVEGGANGGRLGFSISSAGDMNGDGLGDLVVGEPGKGNGDGGFFVYRGQATGALVGAVATVPGSAAEALGHSVGLAGDVNGDGFGDIVIGAPGASSGKGKVYVYRGDATSGALQLDAAHLYTTYTGPAAGDRLGTAVYAAGDVNGDGITDIVTAAPGHTGGQGRVEVFHGAPDLLAIDPAWTQVGTGAGDDLGVSIASAGDVNGDGYADVLVGLRGGSSDRGKVQLYLGGPNGLSPVPSLTMNGENNGDLFGMGVASAGDVNGDGYGDVLIGAPAFRWPLDPSGTWRGKVYLYLGSASGLASSPAWTMEGEVAESRLGWAVASAGDVNGDGYSDVLLGAYTYGGSGKAYVFHGSNATPPLGNTADWTALAFGEASQFASRVSTAGDVNGDGYDDVIIGDQFYEPSSAGSAHNRGAAYVYHGSPTGLSPTVDWSYEGAGHNYFLGNSVSFAGDVNGDGYSDVIIGAPQDNIAGPGLAYVFHGSYDGLEATPATVLSGPFIDNRFGQSVSSAGDVNGDGYGDVVVGATRASVTALEEGTATLFLGSPTGISTSPAQVMQAATPQGGSRFGRKVALAGDVNGDGYGDVIVSAQIADGSTNPSGGGIFLFQGNMGRSLFAPTRQYRNNLTTPVQTNNGAFGAGANACGWGIGQYLRNSQGRSKLKMAWHFAGHGPSIPTNFFVNTSTTLSGEEAGWVNSTLTGVLRKHQLSTAEIPIPAPNPLDPEFTSHPAWRARARFHPATALDGRVFGRWYRQGINDKQVPSIKTNLEICGPLPVTMVAYAVSCQEGVAVLEWSTASERDSKEFVVERSADAHAWEAIGTVAGAGNSEYMRYYGFTDPIGADDGLWYYRLRQVDHNGDFEIFPVLVLTPCHAPGALTAWPNPFEDALNLRLAAPGMDAAGSVQVVVRDLTGRMVLERDLPLSNGTDLRITGWQGLPAGAYLIDVRAPSGASLGQVRAMRL